MTVWDLIANSFTRNEAWGDANKMSGGLLLIFHALRTLVGRPFVVHGGYSLTGHVGDSQHHTGNAIDFHIEGLPFAEAVRLVEGALDSLQIADRVGLGIYPDWPGRNPGELLPGFHIDFRGTRARWGRLNGVYVSYETAKGAIK